MTEEIPSVPIDTNGVWQGQFELTGELSKYYGMMRLEARVVDSDGKCLSPMSETLLSRAPIPLSGFRPNSAFGIHVSLREPDLQVMKNLGYQWLRIHDASTITKWASVEPEEGTWEWHDKQVRLARDQRFCILGMLDSTPVWESQTSHSGYFSIYGVPKNIDKWARYVRTTVQHYKGDIDNWEVWNEPWNMMPEGFFQGGSPGLYVKLLETAYKEAKTVNPNCTILGINTLPAFWDQKVLELGAYPYYDILSWHLYDANLQGRPHDNISTIAHRLYQEQEKYGTPKPQVCTEGGPGLSAWHGSYFSFADPALSGDWSEGADQLSRMYLGCIANSVQKFFLYTAHKDFRYGKAHYHATETGPLLKPMHLSVSALAHFIDGAEYQEYLKPAADISLHIFHHAEDRPFAPAPSTVVVLMADGQDSEDISFEISSGFDCYDRWGNRASVPKTASRGMVYLVASGFQQKTMIDNMRKSCDIHATESVVNKTVDSLIDNTIITLKQTPESFWKLFSPLESLFITPDSKIPLCLHRKDLKKSVPEVLSSLPNDISLVCKTIKLGSRFAMGWYTIGSNKTSAGEGKWIVTFSAVQSSQEESWRYISLTLLPYDISQKSEDICCARNVLARWEDVLANKNKYALYDTLRTSNFCGIFYSFLNSGIEIYSHPHHCLAALQEWIKPGMFLQYIFSPTLQIAQGPLAVFGGELKYTSSLTNSLLPIKSYNFCITMLRDETSWKIASIAIYPNISEKQ